MRWTEYEIRFRDGRTQRFLGIEAAKKEVNRLKASGHDLRHISRIVRADYEDVDIFDIADPLHLVE